jgi:hypothetical protein
MLTRGPGKLFIPGYLHWGSDTVHYSLWPCSLLITNIGEPLFLPTPKMMLHPGFSEIRPRRGVPAPQEKTRVFE